MSEPEGRSTGSIGTAAREAEWRRRLAAVVLAWLAFESASGLSIYFLPFSVPNQWMVVDTQDADGRGGHRLRPSDEHYTLARRWRTPNG